MTVTEMVTSLDNLFESCRWRMYIETELFWKRLCVFVGVVLMTLEVRCWGEVEDQREGESVRRVCFLGGGDGGKYDDGTETRTGLISIIWPHFGSCSKSFTVLRRRPACAEVSFPGTNLSCVTGPVLFYFILMEMFKPLEIGGIPSPSAFRGCYNQSTFSASNFSSTQRQRCCNWKQPFFYWLICKEAEPRHRLVGRKGLDMGTAGGVVGWSRSAK